MVLAVAGGIDKNIKELAEKIFVSKRDKTESIRQDQKISFKQTRSDIKLITKKIEQLHFALGLRTFPRNHPDRYVLGVLKTILGGSTSSRLWNEIREKRGLAYYVRTSNDGFSDSGYLVTQAGCAVTKAEEVLKITRENYFKISQKPVTPVELTLAQDYLKGRLALAWEDSQDVASYLADDFMFESKVRTIKEIYREIDKVTAERVLAVAKKIFDLNQLNLTVVSPLANAAKFVKLLA
jgi:predicted Zn-dependent peptidase